MVELRPFQRTFMRHATAPGIDTAALSLPRGNGKSWLAAHLLTRCLTPGDSLHVPGAEYLLCAGSIEQSRLCFRFIRAELEPSGEYRFIDSATRIGITHRASNTRLTSGVRVSAHVPVPASNRQDAVIRRGMSMTAVSPVWEGISILEDSITKAKQGQVVITAIMLHAVKVLRTGAGLVKQGTDHS